MNENHGPELDFQRLVLSLPADEAVRPEHQSVFANRCWRPSTGPYRHAPGQLF